MATLPDSLRALIDTFATNAEHYRSDSYNETLCRIDFINPFFEALGWDIANRAGYADAYRDVIHEDALKIGGATKAPDYCFRIGGARKFFLEAKKPGVNLKSDPVPAFQLRRYAWSAKLPLSILTDFEEFAVYDCRIQPDQADKASVARVFYCTYEQYDEKWDHIALIFSREAVLKGSFDKFAETARGKRGTAEVDAAFLKEIETWREALARNLALRNESLSQRDLNFAVQRTIDRIIFLRICEDRAIEPYAQLQSLLNGDKVYDRLNVIFRRADEKYNSGIFHFHHEKGRAETPDELTPTLKIDDKVLEEIIRGLYYPDSPYEFSVLPADILGQVYEQFLGKVIRLTAGHRAVVEEKPEVRKAGGVYYTPTYIVDYIVKNTLGRLLNPDVAPGAPAGRGDANVAAGVPAGRPDAAPPLVRDSHLAPAHAGIPSGPPLTPKEAAKLRILDPACGSGSFLIGAYQYLLDWHLNWYISNDPEKWSRGKSPAIYQVSRPAVTEPRTRVGGSPADQNATRQLALALAAATGYRLTTAKRKEILLNNIYGVDIDPQAVEVTKLSLLLKVLEGESGQTLVNQWRLLHERALPDLGRNIKCGNSLIGPDFYDNQQMILLDEEQRLRVNVFDWKREFPQVFRNLARKGAGLVSARTEVSDPTAGFDAVIGNPPYDVLEKERGAASWPHTALRNYVRARQEYNAALGGKLNLFRFFVIRSTILTRPDGRIGMIVPLALLADISCARTRQSLLADTVHLATDCFPQKDNPKRRVFVAAKLSTVVFTCARRARSSDPNDTIRVRVYPWNQFSDNPRECTLAIADLALLDPDNTPIPLVDETSWELCRKLHRDPRVVRLGGLSDFAITRGEINQTVYREFITEDKSASRLLKGVEVGRYHINRDLQQGHRAWLNEAAFLQANSARGVTRERRIATQRITGVDERLRIVATLFDPPGYFADSTNSITQRPACQYQLQYLLALLNSKLFQWRFKLTSTNNNVGTNELASMPYRTIEFSNSADKAAHDRVVSLVHNMFSLHTSLAAANTAHDKQVLERQIDATDRQIDRLVYDLYGLTDDEIRVVEEATRQPSP